ncbi:hypothetical protein BaRGS_00011268, partial [Batillaria attramentaria]
GPDAASTNVTGRSPFITNGTLSMTLTCETSTNPTPYYSWSGVICGNGNSNSTCIYTPSIQDDGKRATCEVTNPENSQVGPVSVEFNVSLLYPPYIVDFTVKGTHNETLTLNEEDHVTVTLRCRAYGRPAPRVYMMKNETVEIASNDVPDKLDFTQVVPYTLGPAQCEHTGNYTVFVNDTQIDNHQRTIGLQVNCAPRLPKRVSSDMDKCPPAISKNGFDLLVVANPSPHNVTVEYLGSGYICRRFFNNSFSDQDKENVDAKHNEGVVNPKFVEDGSGSGSNHDNDSGIEMNGGSSPLEMSPRQSDGAGYASLSDYPPSAQHSGEFRKKSAQAAAYEVTSITSTGKVNIKTAAPQPNAYQDPWDIKKYAKGDNTQGSPAKAQGQEDAAASRCPPRSMTSHALDTPGYATLAEVAPDQGNKGDVTSSSGDAAASESPVQNTSSSGDGTDIYDHFQRDGHDPKSTSQGPGVQYSHIGNY